MTDYDDILPEVQRQLMDPTTFLTVMGLEPADVAGKIVLIAGTGAGSELDVMRQLAPSAIHALDLSSHIRKLATDRPNDLLCQGDVLALPFRGGAFDLVVSSGIIQATPSPEAAVHEMARVLAPGGKIAIGNSYPPNLHNRRVTRWRERRQYHLMDREKAKRLLRRQAAIYTLLIRTGLWRLHRRWPIPGLVEFNGIPGHDFAYYFANACDYYLCMHRHMVSRDDIEAWARAAGLVATASPKGMVLIKPMVPESHPDRRRSTSAALAPAGRCYRSPPRHSIDRAPDHRR